MIPKEIIKAKKKWEKEFMQELSGCEIDSKLLNAFSLHSDPQKCLQAILDIVVRLNWAENERPDFGNNAVEIYQSILAQIRELGYAITWETPDKVYERSKDSIVVLLRLVKYLLELIENER